MQVAQEMIQLFLQPTCNELQEFVTQYSSATSNKTNRKQVINNLILLRYMLLGCSTMLPEMEQVGATGVIPGMEKYAPQTVSVASGLNLLLVGKQSTTISYGSIATLLHQMATSLLKPSAAQAQQQDASTTRIFSKLIKVMLFFCE